MVKARIGQPRLFWDLAAGVREEKKKASPDVDCAPLAFPTASIRSPVGGWGKGYLSPDLDQDVEPWSEALSM
jgi:hypothetical protein